MTALSLKPVKYRFVAVQSLMVLHAMQNGGCRGFNDLMYRGFEKRMRADLAACRVRADLRRGSTSVNTDAAIAEDVRVLTTCAD